MSSYGSSPRANASRSRTAVIAERAQRDQRDANTALTDIHMDARARLQTLLGRAPSTAEIRGMVGAPADAHVSVQSEHEMSRYMGDGSPGVLFLLTGPSVPVKAWVAKADGSGHMEEGTAHVPLYGGDHNGAANRILTRASDGKLEMVNITFRVAPERQGEGHGLRVFAKQAKTLSTLGVARIGAQMAGWKRSSDQGYRIWPRMGYNTLPGAISSEAKQFLADKSIPSTERQRIKRIGVEHVTVLDLYATKAGRAWWDEHGKSHDGYFDLASGSRSMQVLHAYVAAKGLDWEHL